ncbi:hypothetical protein SCORR_v1c04720 [Spiroplasma corruscae]|uniref:Uncharacterized protein n=1 Tax=Spiroplasma corruscae TaxID=216934 RepID=A0A222EPP3_9MOLU|nr:hypothetical protein [Spiroplasma corruscae]ASP28244.1 hypothetical protein SCORR_v1c04720 [Spiroplasma corruscae]
MIKNSYDEEQIDDYEEEDDNDEFVASFTAKQKLKKTEVIEDLTYLEEEVITAYLYPLTTLTGKKVSMGLRVAKDKMTIMSVDIRSQIKIKAYLSQSDDDYDLIETVDPMNPSEQIMRRSENLDFITYNLKEIDLGCLYLLTKEAINEDNFSTVKQYVAKTIIRSVDTDGMEMSFASIEEFSSSFKTPPIKIVLSPPMTEKIKEIHVTTPKGTLVGNIKVVDNDGHFPELIAKEGTEIYPKLCFPFQTQPVLSIVNYWSSDQIIPLKHITAYLDSKGLNYDDDFSLQDFLVLGDSSKYPTLRIDHAYSIRYTTLGKREVGRWKGGSYNGYYFDSTWEDYNSSAEIKVGDKYGYTVTTAPDNKTRQTLYQTITSIEDVNVTSKQSYRYTTAFDTLLLMLTESFWKDYEFKGATKFEYVNGEQVEKINDTRIYEISQKYSQQDRYAVNTNNWLSWKKINQDKVNSNPSMTKRIESTIALLSGYIKSNFSINKGDNDDYKILLPFYFELQNAIDNPVNYVGYTDIKVKLKSLYFEFKGKNISTKVKEISNNIIYKLDYNHYAFPEVTSQVETSSIPSSMPLDQQTANGEYSKYQLKQFSNTSSIQDLIKQEYGNGIINYNPISNGITNNGEFSLDKNSFVSELKVSSFYGSGLWRFNFVDVNNNSFIIDLNLFDKTETKNSFINLIL